MKLNEFAEYDAWGLADLLRRKEVSPAQVRACVAAGLERVNPVLNATAEVFSDRLEHGDPDASPAGAFAGVPTMLKDAGAMEAGRRCAFGSRLFKGHVARRTSNLTRLLKEAGFVNVGRTTVPEGALAGTTESVLYGMTRNPWNPQLSTGGSSGGAAALVAAGVLPVAHGNDGAGSIRMPAALCGLVGLKPSRGRVSLGPAIDEISFGSVAEFVLTRSVRDAAAALTALAEPQTGEPFIIRSPDRPWLHELDGDLKGVRVAWATTNWRTGLPIEKEVRDVVTSTASLLSSLGCDVEEQEPDFDREAAYSYNAFCFVLSIAGFAQFARNKGVQLTLNEVEPVTLSALRKFAAWDVEHFIQRIGQANPIRRQLGAFFDRWDVLLTPTVPVHRLPLKTLSCSDFEDVDEFRRRNEEMQFAFTCPFNITGQPAISVPIGHSAEALPIGVQLVARVADEGLLIRLAAALEREKPWRQRRPPVHVTAGDELALERR